MPYADVNNIQIWYEILGADRPGTPLVMTHGFAGPYRQWMAEIEPFAEKRPVLLYDVRGHDRSSVPADAESYSMPLFASDLAGLMRAAGIERAHVGGVSMGGMVTAQFAVDFPEMCESVILCDTTCGNCESDGPAGDWERQLAKGIATLQHMVRKSGLHDTLLREWEWKRENDAHLAESPYTLAKDEERIKLMTVDGYLGAAHAIETRPDLTGRIRSITAPTLVMCGEWDDFLPCAERDHRLIEGSRFVVRERCGHGSLWRAETFVSEIEAFVADVEAGKAVAAAGRV